MRDSRVTAWNTTTFVSGTAATAGPTIDLLDGYTWTGSYAEGTSLYGVGVEIIAGSVSLGSDTDGFTLTWKWQVSDDNSTWVDGPTIGVIAYDDTNGFTKDGTLTGAALGLTRAKLSSRLRTTKRYARLYCTPSDIESTATVTTNAYISDGSHPFADSGRIY